MLLEKYKPKTLEEFVGSREQIKEVIDCVKNKKPLLLSGQTGTGKSLLIKLVAKKLGYECLEMDSISSYMAAFRERSIFHAGKILLVELDMLKDLRSVGNLLKASAFPVALVTSNLYEKKFQGIRKSCKIVRLMKPSAGMVAAFIKDIRRKEKLNLSDSEIARIAKNCNGDIRSALIDAESGAYERDHEWNIFETMGKLCSSSVADARSILMSSDSDNIFLWLEENTSALENYELLAKADVFRARILKRQSWELKKYFTLLLSEVAVSTKCGTGLKYPRYFSAKNQELLEKIAKKTHTSRKKAAAYVQLIKNICEKDSSIAGSLGLSTEELNTLKDE